MHETEYIDVEKVASMLGVEPATIRRWLTESYIPGGIKLRNRWRVSRRDVMKWVAEMHQRQRREFYKWPTSTNGPEAPTGKPGSSSVKKHTGSPLVARIEEKLRKRQLEPKMS